jgi:hypothetical protein
MSTKPTIAADTLYVSPTLPTHWIAREGHQIVMWPAIPDGWAQRTPYVGPTRALTPCDGIEAAGTGWRAGT